MQRRASSQRSFARLSLSVLWSIPAAAFSLILAAFPAHSASFVSGDLIKGQADAVYYYGQNGKRYVFPNAKTYFTWYTDFSTVKTITADELAAIPIGGNVTYRPGVKLVKITTDSKVYVVAAHGVLRWVKTEAVAKALYGESWQHNVEDIPDAFFTNYTISADIVNAADYSPTSQTAAILNINADQKMTSPATTTLPTTQTATSTVPTATTSSSALFTISKPTAQAGDIISLTASDQGTDGVNKIELFFDGTLIKTCFGISSCGGDAVVPISGTKSSYLAEGRVTKTTNEVLSKTVMLIVTPNSSTLVRIRIGQSVITSVQAASVIADADAQIAVNRIDISVDGNFVKGCATGARQCQWSDYLMGANGSVHTVSARVTDSLGRTYTSQTTTITIGTNDLPGVTVTPALSTIYVGESVDVTTTATDNDGIASIEVLQNGVVLRKCDGAQPCTARTGPWNSTGSVSFTGRATDTKDNVGTSTDPGIVRVQARSTGY